MEKKVAIGITVGIIILAIVLVGYFMFLYYESRERVEGTAGDETAGETAGDGNQGTGNADACLELGCEEGSRYVGSINSDKYYECSCRYASNINPGNIICFNSDEEALANNRVKSEC